VPFIRAGGSTVFYDTTGPREGAPAVVFGNSLGTSVHVWDSVVEAFAAAFRVVRFDMRGHGLTDAGPAPSMDDLASDVVALLDALKLERIRYVGLSIGGMIGQRLAAAHPARVEALVLCATANRIGTPEVWNQRIEAVRDGGMTAISSGVLARWFTPETHERRSEEIAGFRNMLERTPAAGYIGACAAIRDADLAADDARIACPTLVVAGAADPVTPPADAFALRDAIVGARAAVIAGAAHIVPAERPQEFVELVLPFLRASRPAGVL
jgi:3-oxoadipate enol-lactonase